MSDVSAELHIAETAGWRALLTHAQHVGGVALSQPVEEYLVSLLYRHVGAALSPREFELGIFERADRILGVDSDEPAAVGDQCLLCAGLLPEQAISRGIPIAHFVLVGRNAYREFAAESGSAIHASVADEFVRCMDTLQTLRALEAGTPCIDGLNAYNLWLDLGSRHGWRVLRSLTRSLPGRAVDGERVH